MTSTLERTKKTTPAGEAPSERFRLPGPSRTRRPLTAVASAAVVFASIAVFASIYSGAGHQTSVLIVTATIEKGQLISGSDLGQSSVSTSGGITPIPVSSAPELSGRRAAVTIPAGSLLTSGDLTTAQPIATGDAVVGLALKAGQLPSSGLVPGDQVMIVETASPGAPLTAAPVTAVPSGPTVPPPPQPPGSSSRRRACSTSSHRRPTLPPAFPSWSRSRCRQRLRPQCRPRPPPTR